MMQTTEPRSWTSRLIKNPVAILGAIGSLFVVLANAGPAWDGATNVWHRLTDKPPGLDSTWQGRWKSRDGFTFDFAMQLTVGDGNVAEGQISWELVATPPNSFLAPKIGQSAIEYVSGHYDRGRGLATVEGFKVSDPTLLALDSYKFQVKPDKISFVAMSKHRGEWEAQADGSVIITEKH